MLTCHCTLPPSCCEHCNNYRQYYGSSAWEPIVIHYDFSDGFTTETDEQKIKRLIREVLKEQGGNNA